MLRFEHTHIREKLLNYDILLHLEYDPVLHCFDATGGVTVRFSLSLSLRINGHFCGEIQTMSDIVNSCPLTKFDGGLLHLHEADEAAVDWLTTYGS